jgi:hypothetical protein
MALVAVAAAVAAAVGVVPNFGPGFNATTQANMNGAYVHSPTPGSKHMETLFPKQFADYPGGVEMVEVYGPAITTRYSQVWWAPLAPAQFPDWFVKKYDGKPVAIVGWEIDQVCIPSTPPPLVPPTHPPRRMPRVIPPPGVSGWARRAGRGQTRPLGTKGGEYEGECAHPYRGDNTASRFGETHSFSRQGGQCGVEGRAGSVSASCRVGACMCISHGASGDIMSTLTRDGARPARVVRNLGPQRRWTER